jgi:hypothetical protein
MVRIERYIGLAFLIGPCSIALADSDGYYCVGPDYLIYQINEPGVAEAHKLYLVPFTNGFDSISRYELTLPDFQVHDMHCDEDCVTIFGWDAIFHVSWPPHDPKRMTYDKRTKDAGPTQHPGEQIFSLVYGPEQRVELVEPGASVWFLLETRRIEIPELPCTVLATSKLFKSRFAGKSEELVLVARDIPIECGE